MRPAPPPVNGARGDTTAECRVDTPPPARAARRGGRDLRRRARSRWGSVEEVALDGGTDAADELVDGGSRERGELQDVAADEHAGDL